MLVLLVVVLLLLVVVAVVVVVLLLLLLSVVVVVVVAADDGGAAAAAAATAAAVRRGRDAEFVSPEFTCSSAATQSASVASAGSPSFCRRRSASSRAFATGDAEHKRLA